MTFRFLHMGSNQRAPLGKMCQEIPSETRVPRQQGRRGLVVPFHVITYQRPEQVQLMAEVQRVGVSGELVDQFTQAGRGGQLLIAGAANLPDTTMVFAPAFPWV